MVTLYTLGKKAVLAFEKSPPPQKLTKNLCRTLHGSTWPPHLQFASYATA